MATGHDDRLAAGEKPRPGHDPQSDGPLQNDLDPGVALARCLHEPRQVRAHVSTRAEEQRNDADSLRTFGSERGDSFLQRRLHDLEIGQLDEKFAGELARNAFEWSRPARFARAMSEEKDAVPQ